MTCPREFICPITQEIMNEPYIIECGHSFEKEHILIWLEQNSRCPSCRDPVSRATMNWALKSMIDSYLNPSKNPVSITTQVSANIEENASSMEVSEDEITFDSLKDIKVALNIKENETFIRIDAPNVIKRRPVSFVCVIDVSGSMESPIGKAEGNKIFTRLDIVKHVLKVLISTLHENDNLCLITYSDTTSIVLELSRMNKQNKLLAKNYVNGLKTFCNTYTGPALKAAYNEIKKAPKHHVKSIILLTDGHDTAGDDMLFHIFNRIQKPDQIQLNTFGFSNDIKSDCLARLAKLGGGIFAFIPDQSMIGTIFINFLANTFLTFAQDLYIEIDDYYKFELAEQPKKITLQYGQKRYFKVHKKDSNYHGRVTIKIGFDKSNMYELSANEQQLNISEKEINNVLSRYELLKFVCDNRLPKIDIDKYDGLKNIKSDEFLSEFKQIGEPDQNNEQLKLALKYWGSWGSHYLKSISSAHWCEQCLNFKSPSMKVYTYEDFDKLVDEFTDVFVCLPPPDASGKIDQHAGIVAGNSVQRLNLNDIMDARGGCILESCKIKTIRGWKRINQIKKGDIVSNGAKVQCVIKIKYNGPLIQIGKLILTPYHPIFYNNQWIFPRDVSEDNKKNKIIYPLNDVIVYNLVLDKKHIINVEGVSCITLGHDYNHGILKHPYYGSNKCIKEYSNFKGWNEGFISINKFDVLRDENNYVYKTIVNEYGN